MRHMAERQQPALYGVQCLSAGEWQSEWPDKVPTDITQRISLSSSACQHHQRYRPAPETQQCSDAPLHGSGTVVISVQNTMMDASKF